MAPRVLYHVARADFLERVRRYGFLVTLGVTVYGAYMFLPPNHSHYATLRLGDHRGIYNSAWVGSLVAMMTGMFLSLAGFYLVKNAVDRDRATGVGEILATTPLTKAQYTVGKFLSNFALLGAIVAVIAATAAAMQLIRGEDRHLDWVALTLPIALVTLPAMALVAALAVLFETVSFLRGGLGNTVYFFFWMTGLSLSSFKAASGSWMHDPIGVGALLPSMTRACQRAFPGYRPGDLSMGFNIKSKGVWDMATFRWEGADWTPAVITVRLAWIGVALVLVLLAAVPFDRFDHGRAFAPGKARKPRGAKAHSADPESLVSAETPVASTGASCVAPRTVAGRAFRFDRMLAAELRLLLKGARVAWMIVAVGLALGSAFAPLPIARGVLLPFAWVWPMLFWSGMGAREIRHQTQSLVFSAAHPLRRQLPAAWLAGVVLALATGGGVLARFALAGNVVGLGQILAGAIFIPSMALAFGVWSGSGKLFEVLYLMLWYVGPMSHFPGLDWIGATPEAVRSGVPWWFGVAGLALLAIAVIGRRRQVRG